MVVPNLFSCVFKKNAFPADIGTIQLEGPIEPRAAAILVCLLFFECGPMLSKYDQANPREPK